MIKSYLFAGFVLLSGFAAAVPLTLDYIYPAGCKRGESCQVAVGGNWAGNTLALGCSGAGVKAEYVGAVYLYLPKAISKSSSKSKSHKPKTLKYTRQALPGHSLVNVSIDAQAESGVREVYVDYRYEVSNPLKFEISDYDEFVEPATDNHSGSDVALEQLPICLNGRVFGKSPDRYAFQAASGHTLVAFVKTGIIPPGGFIPTLQVADAEGNVITNGVKVYNEKSAPVLVFESASAGQYSLLVGADGTQKGRSAVYRILFGELPLITDFSPRIAAKDESINVKLQGVNLEDERVRLFTGGKNPEMCMQSIAGDSLVLDGLNFDLAEGSLVTEAESNGSIGQAQKLVQPVVVQGTLNAEGKDSDFYSFNVMAGDELYVDVRTPSSAAGFMPGVTVRDAGGKVVAAENNMPDELRSVMREGVISVPCRSVEGETFTVEIARNAGEVSGALAYQLCVGPPVPDYEIWMTPAAINIPLNGSCLVNLYVRRIHGYNAPVSVSVAFPPLGVLSAGGNIAGDKLKGVVTVWTDGYRYPRTPFYQELVAESFFGGALIKKPVRPFMRPSGDRGTVSSMLVSKPPARIAYYETGMCVDPQDASKIVLSTTKDCEIRLLFKNVKGSVADDYDYAVIVPATGVVVKGVNESSSDEIVRLQLALDGKGGFNSGDKGDMIIGMYKKGEKKLVTASQSVAFTCK